MAGSWDFTADSDIQKDLSNNLNEAADKFDVKVSDMYKEIDSLGSNSYWVGEDYDAFKTGTEGYKNALQDLSDGIRMYGKHFEEMAGGTDTLATELINIVQNMTGSMSGGGSSSGTGGTGGTGDGSADRASDDGLMHDVVDPSTSDNLENDKPSKIDEVGGRYADDWNKYTSSLSSNFSNVDGAIGFTGAVLGSAVDTIEFAGDAVFDTVHAVDTGLETGINWVFDGGTSRDYNFINDMAENWDYSSCDNAAEYVGTTAFALGKSAVDLVQGGCNLVTGAVDLLSDGANAVWDFIF